MTDDGGTRPGYFYALGRHWKPCTFIPLGLGIAAFAAALVLPKSYRAESVVQITTIDFGPDQIKLKGLSAQEAAAFFRDDELFQEALTTFGLGEKPYEYDRERLRRSLVEIQVPRAIERIEIKASMPSPELARDLVNFVARRGAESCQRHVAAQCEQITANLQRRHQAARDELGKAEAALEQFAADAEIEVLRALVEVQRSLRAEREKRQAELKVELACLQEQAKSYETSLGAEQRVLTLKRSLADDPAMQQLAAKATGKQPHELTGISLNESVLNPLYVRAAELLIDARGRQAARAAELAALAQAAQSGDKLLTELAKELAGKERRLSELSFNRDAARRTAGTALTALDRVKMIPIWPPVRMSIIPAKAPLRPYWPRKAPLALATLFCSFLVVWALAAALDRPAGKLRNRR